MEELLVTTLKINGRNLFLHFTVMKILLSSSMEILVSRDV